MARRTFLRDVVSVLSSNIFAIINGLLVSIILSRSVGPEGYGIYSAILVVPLLVMSIIQMGVRGSAIYLIGKKKFSDDVTVSNIIVLLLLTSTIGILVSLLVFALLNNENFTLIMILLVVMLIPSRLANMYIGGIFLGKEQISRAYMFVWLTVLLDLIAVILFVWLLKLDVAGAILSALIASYIVTIVVFRIIYREYKIKLKIDRKVSGAILRLGVLFAISFAIIQLNYRIDILILDAMRSEREVGYYSLGVSIAEKLWQLPMAIGVVLMSRTANATDQEMINQSTAKLVRVSILAEVLAMVILFFIAPLIIPLIWGADFQPSVKLLQYLLPGILFVSLYRILSSRLSGIGLPQISIYVFLPTLVINVLLNLWWIPVYGAMGAVMATNISYTIGSIAYVIVYSRVVGMPISEIFKYRKSDFSFIPDLKRKLLNKYGPKK